MKAIVVVLFGSAKDHEAGNEILAALNTEQQAWCRNLAGNTVSIKRVILIAACKAICHLTTLAP